jgi:DNA mismatch endonuclease (patch repair protein)
MPDVHTPEQRSRNMAAIRGRNTKPEMLVRPLVHAMGYRFRLHRRDLPGTPDLVLPRFKAVIFVHGCFWHRHARCRYAYLPKTRRAFWNAKFRQNMERDRRVVRKLRLQGWSVIIVWECQISNPLNLAKRLNHVLRRY